MRDNIKTPMTLKTTDVYVGVCDMRRAADKREESASLYKLVHKGSNATADQWLAIGSRGYEVECPFRVKRFVLNVGQLLLVYPNQRTSSDRPGSSGSRQKQTSRLLE